MSVLQVTSAGVTLGSLPRDCLSVDVSFDGRRVWTIEIEHLSERAGEPIAWPEAMIPHLTGRTEVVVADSASGEEFLRSEVEFSGDDERTRVVNDQGDPLTINKWGDLAPELTGMSADTLEHLLGRTQAFIAQLQELDLRPFVVGGTLLGAVREGRLLPHDDDADIAYLSRHTSPLDVAIESFELGHRLRHLGYKFVRHSAAHIQVEFRENDGGSGYHIDIFSAFLTEDGNVNQPFHVRGPLREDQILPFSTVAVGGREFPAPADPESWLVINYDENWRTPIPGYRLDTPEETRRRFENWFGGYNFQREFWDRWHEQHAGGRSPWVTGESWLSLQRLVSPTLLELGCGAASLSRALATAPVDRRIIASDYSEAALETAASTLDGFDVDCANINLNRFDSLGFTRALSVTGRFDVVANHVLEQVSRQARAHILRIVRMALRSGGAAFATSYGMHASDLSPEDPTTWHLVPAELMNECEDLGLQLEIVPLKAPDDEQARRPYGVRFALAAGDENALEGMDTQKRNSMKNQARKLARRVIRGSTASEVEVLKRRVQQLENELDEQRRDSLRVAEMMDLIEQRLTPAERHLPNE